MGEVRAQSSGPTPSSLCDVGLTAYSRELYGVPFSYITSSPSFSLRDGRASETRARVKTIPRVKGEPFLSSLLVSPFLLGVIFTRARVSLDLPSLREN